MKTTLSFIGIIALLLSVTSCGSNSNEAKNEFKYLAVKLDKSDNWSIMNDKGKIVVKEELAYGSILIQVLQKKWWITTNQFNSKPTLTL